MVESGHSVLVIGETGPGVDDLAVSVRDRFEGEFTCATETYKGTTKIFFKSLAEQVGCPTELEVGEGKFKPMSVDEMKDEILSNASDDWLFILPEAKRLPASIRYWLEDAIASGVRVVAFSPINPGRDVFLRMLEVELELPSDAHIRSVMTSEAQRLGLQIDQSRIAELQPLAGRNPTSRAESDSAREVGHEARQSRTHPRNCNHADSGCCTVLVCSSALCGFGNSQ